MQNKENIRLASPSRCSIIVVQNAHASSYMQNDQSVFSNTSRWTHRKLRWLYGIPKAHILKYVQWMLLIIHESATFFLEKNLWEEKFIGWRINFFSVESGWHISESDKSTMKGAKGENLKVWGTYCAVDTDTRKGTDRQTYPQIVILYFQDSFHKGKSTFRVNELVNH